MSRPSKKFLSFRGSTPPVSPVAYSFPHFHSSSPSCAAGDMPRSEGTALSVQLAVGLPHS